MNARYYAIRWEHERLVAAEIEVPQAAQFLEAARPVLLSTPVELMRLARQGNRALVLIAAWTVPLAQPALAGTADAAARPGQAPQGPGQPARVWFLPTERREASAVGLPAA